MPVQSHRYNIKSDGTDKSTDNVILLWRVCLILLYKTLWDKDDAEHEIFLKRGEEKRREVKRREERRREEKRGEVKWSKSVNHSQSSEILIPHVIGFIL